MTTCELLRMSTKEHKYNVTQRLSVIIFQLVATIKTNIMQHIPNDRL